MPGSELMASVLAMRAAILASLIGSQSNDETAARTPRPRRQFPGQLRRRAHDCDRVIRILDRNGKGNTKDSHAVAKVMIPQGAWRRMLNQSPLPYARRCSP
jgi:hypothetical protein